MNAQSPHNVGKLRLSGKVEDTSPKALLPIRGRACFSHGRSRVWPGESHRPALRMNPPVPLTEKRYIGTVKS